MREIKDFQGPMIRFFEALRISCKKDENSVREVSHASWLGWDAAVL